MTSRMRALGFLCLFSTLGLTCTAQQPVTAPAFGEKPFTMGAAELQTAAAAMPPNERYPAQILLEEESYRFAANGTLLYQHRMVYRVDSQAALEGWSEVSAGWDPWFQEPAQLQARILKPDGHFVELDPKTITDSPVKETEADTFSSGHVRRAPLPGMTVGAVVEEVETTEEKTPYFSAGGVYSFHFRQRVPAGRVRMIVDLPASVSFNDAVQNLPGLVVSRSASSGVRHVVYEATGLAAEHDADIDLPTNESQMPMVEFATGESWGKVASTYASLSEPQTSTEEARAILPAKLPADRFARIQAIVQQLHKEVRYTGVEFGEAQLMPQRPAEVIGRHYGDCKDKATLLVAMLRAAAIPAYLALVSTGPGRQLNPDLPGMNRFDHAIVYVPAAGAEKALWIDATAQYDQAGTLPFGDQGRFALVIAPETKALVQTPAPQASDSLLIETRTFSLPEYGAAHVVEESDTHGHVDANFRASYGGTDTSRLHEQLEGYIKQAYLAKSLSSLKHGDAMDLTVPFRLTLTAEGARRGFTSMDDAVVAIFPNATANDMPRWFSIAPQVLGSNASPDEAAEHALAERNRAATYTFQPFHNEQRTRILVPPGFAVRSLPEGKTTKLGTATLTETYSTEADAVVADFTFDSGPSTITAEQALAMRAAMLQLNQREYVGIYLDQVGAKALAAGHIREALQADRSLIAQQPGDALNHVRLAQVLLKAGIGEAARSEARRATELDPKSAQAFAQLGWVLEHNNLGQRFARGYDRPDAVAAYRQSVKLDPEDNDLRFNLAVLYEYNVRGVRYGPDADLTDAANLYRDLVERTKDKDAQAADQDRENLLYALLYSRQFKGVEALLTTLPSSVAHTALAISTATALHGAPAGIARAGSGNITSADKNTALRQAGVQLAQLRLYPEAADVLSAGVEGEQDAPTVARQIGLFRSLTGSSTRPLPPSDPASPVQTVMFGLMAGTLTRDQMIANLSREGYSTDAAYEHDIDKTLAHSDVLWSAAKQSNISETILFDLLAGNIKFTSTGNRNDGYAVTEIVPGAPPQQAYVTWDAGAYRILAQEHDDASIGKAALQALAEHNAARAKAMLDWRRDLLHKAGGDDPFSGPLLPRFWTIGSVKEGADSPEAIRLAAISLLAQSTAVRPYLADIAAARERATGQRQTDLDLLLAEGGIGAEEPTVALPAAQRLLEGEPDSATALRLAGAAYMFQNDATHFEAMLAPRLSKRPANRDLLLEQERAYELTHDFAAAQATAQKVLDSGKAESSDYNSFAWLGLFTHHVGEEHLKAAQQANMLSKNSNFGDLHTLACIYAAEGRTTEARQVLEEAMVANQETEPDSAVWYALGLIYEQYGELGAALLAYQHVKVHEYDDRKYIDAVDTYRLAQARLESLQGATHGSVASSSVVAGSPNIR